jgi:hypothetical protein
LCGLTLSDTLALIENAPNINWDCLQESDLIYPIVSYYVLHRYVKTDLKPYLPSAYEYYKYLRSLLIANEFINTRFWDIDAKTFVATSLPYNRALDRHFEEHYNSQH